MAENFIHGKEFLAWLGSFGIIPEKARRVVIDASVDSMVSIYVEMYGTRPMIEIEPPPELRTGVTILQSED